MLSGLEFECGGSLALAVVQVPFVRGDDLANWSEIGIDEDMEVSGALVDFARRFDGEPGCRHNDFEGRGDGCAVSELLKSHRRGWVAGLYQNSYGVSVLVPFESSVKTVSELEAKSVLSGLEFE